MQRQMEEEKIPQRPEWQHGCWWGFRHAHPMHMPGVVDTSLEAGFGGHSCPRLCWSSIVLLTSEQLRFTGTTESGDRLALHPEMALPAALRQLSPA